MAILNQGESYRVFSNGGHYVVAYKAVGENVEVFDPYWYAGKYSAQRTVDSTSRGCIVNIAEIAKATGDRNPAYYLISYSKTPLNNSPIQPLDAKPQSVVKNYAKPITLYCTTTGGLRFRKAPSTSSGLVQGANGGASVIGFERVPREKVSRYGIAKPRGGAAGPDGVFELESLVEKPRQEDAPSDYAVAGRYLLDVSVFAYLADQTAGVGGEIQLTDAICRMIGEKRVLGYVYPGRRQDIGNPDGYFKALEAYHGRN